MRPLTAHVQSRQNAPLMRPFVAALLLLTAACPQPDDCSAAKPCAGGFNCLAGLCEPTDGGTDPCGETPPLFPKNLVPNPGYECGNPPTGWYADHGKLAAASNAPWAGASFARLSDSDGWPSLNLWLDPNVVSAPGTRTFCTRAWMRGSSVGRVTVREVVNSSSVNDVSFSSPVDGNWQVVPPEAYGALKIVGNNEQRYLLRFWVPNPTPADWLEVDDAQVWESADGGCMSR